MPSMSHMREKVEKQFKPMLEMLRAELLPNGRLLAGAMELVISHYEETFRVMDERKKKLCWPSKIKRSIFNRPSKSNTKVPS